jgi:hypothetical protein
VVVAATVDETADVGLVVNVVVVETEKIKKTIHLINNV